MPIVPTGPPAAKPRNLPLKVAVAQLADVEDIARKAGKAGARILLIRGMATTLARRRVDALHPDAPARPGRKRNLNPSHQEQDDEYDENDADYADTAVTVAVAVAAEAAAESPEQEDDK
jgi:hypothetical protein